MKIAVSQLKMSVNRNQGRTLRCEARSESTTLNPCILKAVDCDRQLGGADLRDYWF